ncbi:MAG: HlyC/CorC family transporter [Alphaproteobacteria bacterium]|nr:MAG: HlyC/CorC family transporter [Alphaproteobacteria bacterium]
MSDTSGPRAGDGLFGRLKGLFQHRGGDTVRETIEELIADDRRSADPLEAGERSLLQNILRLRDVRVEDVMVPRGRIIAIESTTPFSDVVGVFADQAHSRLPVYRDGLDDVIGMLHVKDVLQAHRRGTSPGLDRLMRKVLFVPPSMSVVDCLRDMRLKRLHLAIVVDEYGGTDGLVTIEDLVEQIVGDILDEHDEEEVTALETRPDGTLVADAAIPLDALEARLGRFLTGEERDAVETLGGLVARLAGRLPEPGAVIAHPAGVEFEVLAGDARRISRVRVRNLPISAVVTVDP